MSKVRPVQERGTTSERFNRVAYRDAGAAAGAAQIQWTAFDGTEYDPRTGAATTGLYTQRVQSKAPGGKQIEVYKSTGAIGTESDRVMDLTDAGLAIGAGGAAIFWNLARTNSVSLIHSETNGLLKTPDSLQVNGGLNVGTTVGVTPGVATIGAALTLLAGPTSLTGTTLTTNQSGAISLTTATTFGVVATGAASITGLTIGLTGPTTITGTLTVTGLVTAQAGLTVTLGNLKVTAGVVFTGATLVPAAAGAGSGSFSPLWVYSGANYRYLGLGGTSFVIGNDSSVSLDDLTINSVGMLTMRGGLTATAGGLTVVAGGAAITGTATITGALSVSSTVTITSTTPTILAPSGTQLIFSVASVQRLAVGTLINLVNATNAAVGAGATAILGKLGGSTTPTAAAQAGWVKLQLDGTGVWLPYWL